MGIGAGIAGGILELIGYAPGLSNGNDFDSGIKAILCLIPIIGTIGAFISLSFYDLNYKLHAEFIALLSDRHDAQ